MKAKITSALGPLAFGLSHSPMPQRSTLIAPQEAPSLGLDFTGFP